MNDLKKRYLKSIKCIVMTMTFLFMVLTGIWNCQSVKAATTTSVTPTVSFDTATESLTVKNGTIAYCFYTTANASKSVPAQNQWLRTNNGSVDVSSFTSGKTIYFAMSTSPELTDIVAIKVPASPTLTKAVYDAKTGDFTFMAKVTGTNTTVNSKGKTVVKRLMKTITVPTSRIQIKLNDNSATWQDYSTAMISTTLASLQKEGATIYARIKPSTAVEVNNNSGVYEFKDNGTNHLTTDTSTDVYDKSAFVRCGISKSIKITKKSMGPVVSIDYANHCMTIKKGQSYGKTTNVYADPSSSAWTAFSSDNPKVTIQKIYFGTNGYVTATEYYALKTDAVEGKSQDSMLTFIDVPATEKFADTGSEVTIQGGFGENATMQIKYTTEAKSGVVYQYAIVDLSDTEKFKDLIGTNKFDYSNTNVKWVNVKTDKTGIAKVALKWSAVGGKQILVRKAAVGKQYSSAVEVLNAPTGQGNAAYGTTTAMPSINCWTKLTNATYGNGFQGNNKSMTFCPNISEVTYDATNGTLKYTVVGSSTVASASNITLKLGNKIFNDISAAVSGAASGTYNYDVTITLSKLEGYSGVVPSNSLGVIFTFKDGIFNTGNISSVGKKSKLTKIDNKPITLKSVTAAQDADTATSGTITYVFDSQLMLGTTELLDGTDIDIAKTNFTVTGCTITSAKYDWNKKKNEAIITLNYSTAKLAAFTVTLPKTLMDAAGNLVTIGTDSGFTAATTAKGAVVVVDNPSA